MALRGRCLCEAVVWSADGPPGAMWHCHCRACRKAGGAGFATWLEADAGTFRFEGEERVTGFASSPARRRCFCSRCGSVLPWRTTDERRVWLPAGSLESDPGVRPLGHAFATERAPWQSIDTTLPLFAGEHGSGEPLNLAGSSDVPAGPVSVVPGSCLCGDVRYEVADPQPWIWHCHCSRDRRVTGAGCDAAVAASLDGVRWLAGREQLVVWKVPETSYFHTCFCRRCGGLAPNPNPPPDSEELVVPAGPLDADPGARPRVRIFWGSRAPWCDAPDDLPRFDEYSPETR